MSSKSKANKTIKTLSGKSKSSNNISSVATKKKKRKTNLLKLCNEMNNYILDANDKEILKRFKTTISSSIEEDISKASLDLILKNIKEVEIHNFSESIQPYIKHYIFMVNRSKSKK